MCLYVMCYRCFVLMPAQSLVTSILTLFAFKKINFCKFCVHVIEWIGIRLLTVKDSDAYVHIMMFCLHTVRLIVLCNCIFLILSITRVSQCCQNLFQLLPMLSIRQPYALCTVANFCTLNSTKKLPVQTRAQPLRCAHIDALRVLLI